MLGQAQIDEAGLASDLGRARERREYLSRCTAVGDAIAGPKADGRRQGSIMATLKVTHNGHSGFTALWFGMFDNFRMRAAAWIMSATLTWIGLCFLQDGTLFNDHDTGFRYVYLGRILGQHEWAWIILGIGGFRLLAHVVNGTFENFPWSAHIRCVGAAVSCFVWVNIWLGFVQHNIWSPAAGVYFGLLTVDCFNTYVAALEIER